MKLRWIGLLTAAAGVFLLTAIPAAAEQDSGSIIQEYQDRLREMVEGMDEETIHEAFDFLQEKAASGELDNEEEMKAAIQEGEDKLGVTVGEDQVKEMLELVDTLEGMGFDSEKILGKAEDMYQEYGADFVDHSEELVTEAVKDSLGTVLKNAFTAFFKMLGDSIRDFFTNLF